MSVDVVVAVVIRVDATVATASIVLETVVVAGDKEVALSVAVGIGILIAVVAVAGTDV
jgi:hypothetical protein